MGKIKLKCSAPPSRHYQGSSDIQYSEYYLFADLPHLALLDRHHRHHQQQLEQQ